jgi:hypothetical protein
MKSESTYGISRISILPMRSEPDHRSEMVNQLLFGEHYTVLRPADDGKWLKIQSAIDRYEGWIQREQYHEISADYFEQVGLMDYRICTDLFTSILFNKTEVNITIGSILPISSNEIFEMEGHLAFNGESKALGQKRDAEFIEQVAKKYVNTPYLWGGKSPFGIDCSGFTQIVYRIAGYSIPRDSSQQVMSGKQVEYFAQAAPGDLVILADENGKVDHVGIMLEGEKIIHASGKVRIDRLTPDGIFKADTNILSHHLHSIRRVIL